MGWGGHVFVNLMSSMRYFTVLHLVAAFSFESRIKGLCGWQGTLLPSSTQVSLDLPRCLLGQLVESVQVREGQRILYNSIVKANITIHSVAASMCLTPG